MGIFLGILFWIFGKDKMLNKLIVFLLCMFILVGCQPNSEKIAIAIGLTQTAAALTESKILESPDAPSETPLPESTPTNGPTKTPSPTRTVSPTNTPVIGTFDNPVPLGVGHRFPGYGTLTVNNSSWMPGETGLAIVELSFDCERPAGQECQTSNFMLYALGGSGNGYSPAFDMAIPNPHFGSFINPPVYGGGVEEGYYGFLVTEKEDSLKMRVNILFEINKDDVFYTISN